jgi:hypothetical protein
MVDIDWRYNMERDIQKSIKLWTGLFIAIISYYIVHEGVHLLLALLFGVFERIRFVGLWGVQIVTTEGGLAGIKLAVFSGLSSIVTVIIGYILAFSPSTYKVKNKNILIAIYYITLCFMILDPLYISILSLFIGGGGDLNGIVTGLGTSDISFRIVFGIISIISIILFKKRVAPKYKEIFKEEN